MELNKKSILDLENEELEDYLCSRMSFPRDYEYGCCLASWIED